MEQTMIPDTHSFIKNMAAAGMPEPVAEAFVTNYTKHLVGNLATKQDIEALRAATEVHIVNVQRDIEKSRGETNTAIANVQRDIERAKNNLTWRFAGLLLAFAGLIVALVKLL